MSTADYQLRSQALSFAGSFWGSQVTEGTKIKARAVAEASAMAPRLQRLDLVTAHASGRRDVFVEDMLIPFIDGQFAKTGTAFEKFDRVTVTLDESGPTTVSSRNPSALDGYPVAPKPHAMALIPEAFADLPESADLRDRYYIQIPAGVSPIIIKSADGSPLTAGVDFDILEGWLVTTEPPGSVFGQGCLHVTLAQVRPAAYNSYVLNADARYGNTFVAAYAKATQSIKAFKRAAAEAAGLFVFPSDDMVLYAKEASDNVMLYVFATAGAVTLAYPHQKLKAGDMVAAGYIISNRFDVHSLSSYGYGMMEDISAQLAVSSPEAVFNLDGCLPVKGLSWTPGTQVAIECDGTLAKMQLSGSAENLQALWDVQSGIESLPGNYSLADQYGLSDGQSVTVSFGSLLESFYAGRLTVMVYDELPAVMEQQLLKFVAENKPTGCVLIVAKMPGVEVPAGYTLLRQYYGDPVLQGSGAYIFTAVA